jgi:hypothetical protein
MVSTHIHTLQRSQLTVPRPAILIGLFVAFGGVLFGSVSYSFYTFTSMRADKPIQI